MCYETQCNWAVNSPYITLIELLNDGSDIKIPAILQNLILLVFSYWLLYDSLEYTIGQQWPIEIVNKTEVIGVYFTIYFHLLIIPCKFTSNISVKMFSK